ncbi:lysophospholipid acyltransferase family protein [Desertimonas flava]|uniref:lysophospholipid acyltransferase family protein n=1 Tax=Desertimonas flava TaxID=2064846 RepID=UPI000E3454DA|nr:lysophospholipid acyltransferase family protein [Desertimonas flava]
MLGASGRLARLRLAPDGRPRPDAPFGRGPVAARVLAKVISGAVWAGSRTPSPVAHGLATVGGHLEWAARPAKRRRLAANLSHAIGLPAGDRRVRRAVRRELVNEAHRSADLLWALGRPDEFLAAVELDGIEHAQAAAATGRGVVLAGLHVGGWELATVIPKAVLPVPATAIVADDWLAWAIQHMRNGVGLHIVYRSAPVSRLGALLKAGEALVVLSDDANGDQPRLHKVEFCDTVAELPAGAVTLARLYQSPIVGFAIVRLGPRKWRAIVDPPLEPPARRSGAAGDLETLQVLAHRWTALVREYPDQWSASYDIAWLE